MDFLQKITSFFHSSKKDIKNNNIFGISMTDDEIEHERQFNENVFDLLESKMRSSGYFKGDKIDILLKLIKDNSKPFSRINTKISFEGESLLSVEEKRNLGLNTRMKYSTEFIDCFNQSSFSEIEPKSALECMHLDAFHKMSRKREIEKFKQLGWVKKVRLNPDNDCCRAKKLKKIYEIDAVPDLPLPNCEEPYCRCFFEAIIPK